MLSSYLSISKCVIEQEYIPTITEAMFMGANSREAIMSSIVTWISLRSASLVELSRPIKAKTKIVVSINRRNTPALQVGVSCVLFWSLSKPYHETARNIPSNLNRTASRTSFEHR